LVQDRDVLHHNGWMIILKIRSRYFNEIIIEKYKEQITLLKQEK
jgi:hypothetical protein